MQKMVTLITDKLEQQTLEEISSAAKSIQSEQLKNASKEREPFDFIRKPSKASQHRRSHTARDIQTESIEKEGSEQALSFSITGRCNSYPPAKKRVCRSHSDPYKDGEIKCRWRPEPSSIWTPVKPSSGDRTKPTGARSLEFTNKEISNWSTPPESPVPRPVSANSVLEESKFFPLRLITEERNDDGSFSSSCSGRGCQLKPCSSSCSCLPRSHSHPSFSHIVNSGLKRRLSEVDIPRPTLDFDKMKARSFVNPNLQKRTVKSPKYSGRRHMSASPKIPSSSKSVRNVTNLNISVDLSSSLMITPTASPTNNEEVILEDDSCVQHEDENANPSLGSISGHKYFGYETLKADTELDIKLIEEDGTLNDNEIHNTYNIL